MVFQEALPTEDFPGGHLVSETGRWEMGFRPMLFGVRVSAGLVGDGGVSIDYCAGTSPVIQHLLHRILLLILQSWPESASPDEIRATLPTYTIRPIDRDAACWNRLIVMAVEATEHPHARD